MHYLRTRQQAEEVVTDCFQLFSKKLKDYGTAWRILRLPSLTDQIFIKVQRIRTIEEKKQQMVQDSIENEYVGIINYAIMALIQLDLGVSDKPDIDIAQAENLYQKKAREILALMDRKNHDYGEAWRDMRISSYTDLILQKLLRIKQIEDNQGATLVSEGIDANYMDIVNYAIFALIRLKEEKTTKS
ncbi:hypothetical protein JCM31826_14200 [Thermaurantimonas aggregans]|uniref:Nucleotide modification associated domain-containing protein n=1 Tax=Thermaurantimonas aggregans TaxID=2173829 RepID=A0A401XLR4_9FLAO|nr:DUF1599 domain-containing protein [Thermaurantimonas aggregans]MCX8147812.1 DUF1599 domain-containing protein [Thermaurantimonas aggregans]GCD77938.1 hypothetical protein JCM31826_14200 [Thermaurantimonas aggregans]